MTNKVIEGIGMAKPLITQRNAPVQELLTHGESVYLVPAADPQALADAIRTLKNDPALREKIARNGYAAFEQYCSSQKTGEAIEAMCREAMS